MKKRSTALFLLALAVALLLASCGKQEQTPAVYDTGLVDRLAEGGAFSEELESLEADVLWMLYRLEQAGLSREQLTAAAALRASGATCEEAAVLVFDSEQSAQTAVQALKDYLADQIQSNRDYRPAAIPTLEAGSVDRRENTVLLLVATDREAAGKVIDGK